MIDLSKLITAADKRNQLLESAVDAIRLERQKIIGVLDGLQASALARGDMREALGIETAKQALRDLTKLDLTTCATHEDMRAKVKLAYHTIVSAAPASVVRAFNLPATDNDGEAQIAALRGQL